MYRFAASFVLLFLSWNTLDAKPLPISDVWLERGEMANSSSLGAHHWGLGVSRDLWLSASERWQLKARVRLGQIESGWNKGTVVGGGFQGLFVPHPRFELIALAEALYLDRYRFRDANVIRNLGGPIQFFIQAGFAVGVTEHIFVGYQFGHISNASRYSDNPGLNLHQIALKYRF